MKNQYFDYEEYMQTRIDKLESKKIELKKKQDDLNKQIRMLKSKEANEKRKKENHYKILLGAFLLNEISLNTIDDETKRRLKGFINNDEKYYAIVDFINEYKNQQNENQ